MWVTVGAKIINSQEGPGTHHTINCSLQTGQPGWSQAQGPGQNHVGR